MTVIQSMSNLINRFSFYSSASLHDIIISDRIIVMCNGEITGEVSESEATQENIMSLATRF